MKKKKNNSGSSGELFTFAADSYLERTSRPIYSIIFLLPFIVFYELGTLFINSELLSRYWQGRVTAFAWLQGLLGLIGFSNKFAWVATPLLVVIILLAMQITSKKRWSIWPKDFIPMSIECIVLAVPLIVLGMFINSPPKQQADLNHLTPVVSQTQTVYTCSSVNSPADENDTSAVAVILAKPSLLADLVTSIGAGIYEELVFRLILICLLMLLFQDLLRFGQGASIIFSILISAALFSAHHHIDFLSGTLNPTDTFEITKFSFRALAGIYFAAIFAVRGFGVTAATHAFYDIIAVVINAAFFKP